MPTFPPSIKISALPPDALPVPGEATALVVQGGVTVQAPVDIMQVLGIYSELALPTPMQAGSLIYVPDASGGPVVAFSDGAMWRRVTDRSMLGPAGGPISSAAVFDSNNALVRNIWVAQTNDPRVADPIAAWDGTLDDGSIAPTGNYTVTLLEHNIQYVWEGVIGNSSPPANHIYNLYYHNGSAPIVDLDISDAGDMFYTTSYDERWSTWRFTTTANPQAMDLLYTNWGFRNSRTNTINTITDGTLAYSSFMPIGGGFGDVVAVNCSDKSQYTGFTANGDPGTDHTYCALDSGATTFFIVGLAVQKTGTTLFVSRIGDLLETFNKTTGAPLNSYTIWKHVSALDSSDATGDLWALYSVAGSGQPIDSAIKLTVGVGGALTASGVVISGLTHALDLAVSPDGATLLVVMGDPIDQVWAFNTFDGSAKTAFGTSGKFGTLGGYAGSPAVTKTKWAFESFFGFTATGQLSCVAYVSDGSWWMTDPGNCRTLHFSSGNSPTYIEEISFIPAFYGNRICKNDNTRVFAYYLEFHIDYSVPLGNGNGSWTLVNNWSGGLTQAVNGDQYQALRFVGVFSNGRTYATYIAPGGREIFELTAFGRRDCGIFFSNDVSIDENLNLITMATAGPGQVGVIKRNPLVGFDGSSNPVYQFSVSNFSGWNVVLTTQTLPPGFPPVQYGGLNMEPMRFDPFANGVIPFYNPDFGNYGDPPSSHFGGIDSSTGRVRFASHPRTPDTFATTYQAMILFPEAPFGDRGNLCGGFMAYLPGQSHIFTLYRGEGWASNQTTMWDHWYQNGMLLTRFGVPMPYFSSVSLSWPPPAGALTLPSVPATDESNYKGMPQAAGNAAMGGVADVGGNYYLYCGDEWYHGGIHRWKCSGRNTLRLTNFPVAWNSANYNPTVDPTDLLAGLPFAQINVPDGSAGWHRDSPNQGTNGGSSYLDNSGSPPYCHLSTNVSSCNRYSPSLMWFEYLVSGPFDTHVTRGLSRSGSGNWYLDGTVYFEDALASFLINIYYEVLDNAGKVIVRVYLANAGTPIPGISLYVNDDSHPLILPKFSFTGGPPDDTSSEANSLFQQFQHLRIEGRSTGITVTYKDTYQLVMTTPAEAGANFLTPTTFQLHHTNDLAHAGQTRPTGIGIGRLNFGDL